MNIFDHLLLTTNVGQDIVQSYLNMPLNANIFEKAANFLQSTLGYVQKLAVPLGALMICIAAAMYMYSDRMSDKAKSWALKIVIGIIIMLGAGTVASWVASNFKF